MRLPDPYSYFLQGANGKGVILVHGLTGSPAEMKYVAKHLHKMGFTVYAPTLAGHCMDKEALLATTYEDWLESVRTSVFLMRPDVDEIHIAGICVGGALALVLAAQEDFIRSVTVYSPAFRYDGWNTPFYYSLSYYSINIIGRIPLLNRIGFEETHPYGFKSDRVRQIIMSREGAIEGTLPDFPIKALYENYSLMSALEKALPSIKTPTLLIHAREDDISHPRNSYEIQKLHSGECRIELLENSYHMIHVDQERQKVAYMTADFVGIPDISKGLKHAAGG